MIVIAYLTIGVIAGMLLQRWIDHGYDSDKPDDIYGDVPRILRDQAD